MERNEVTMEFYPGFDIMPQKNPFGFRYGKGVFGPAPEIRRLDDIRASLANPDCQGPEELYAISMDVGYEADQEEIRRRNLLYGAVTYAAGVIGKEPVRSQGHIHAVSPSCGYSTPEVYEIWDGEAIIYMQESGEDDPGTCYGVHAKAGEVVIVPPGWVHATVNGSVDRSMTFGAWCVRDFGFEYEAVRSHGGIAYFPYEEKGAVRWKKNQAYSGGRLVETAPREYAEFGITRGEPIYTQFRKNMEKFAFVTRPREFGEIWKGFRP